MVRALIVAKTHMGNDTVCIGALNLETNQNIRLLGANGAKQTVNTKFDVGQIWDINFQKPATIKPPHIEDVIVDKAEYVCFQDNLRDFLLKKVKIWQGGAECLFEGFLTSDRQSAFVPEYMIPPSTSVGFWLPETTLRQAGNPEYYMVNVKADVLDEGGLQDEKLYIKYVGFKNPINQIPAGSLVRVSLARWWRSPGASEQRCYLQLSGWYL